MRRFLPFLLFFVPAAEAGASCIYPEPRRQIRTAEAAFVGRFESQRGPGYGPRRLTFRVERVVKGELGETVEVYEPGMSSISMPNFAPGQRVGLMMNRHTDGTWRSVCQQADPDELADALKPIPRPPGRGAAAFLVGGNFGDRSVVALDRRGRTVAYGTGGWPAAVCPGGRRFVVLGHRRFTVRRTRDLRVIGRGAVPMASEAHCTADGVYVAGSRGIYRGTRRIWTGTRTGLVFRGGDAFVLREQTLLRVSLRTGQERRLAEVPLTPQHEPLRTLAVNRRYLAILAQNYAFQPNEPPPRLAVFDRRTKQLRVADLPERDLDGEVAWVSRDRFAFLPGPAAWYGRQGDRTALFYGADLQPLGSVPGWTVGRAVGGDGAVVGIVGHRVERGSPSGHSELGRLPGSFVGELLPLGSRVDIRWSRRVPRY